MYVDDTLVISDNTKHILENDIGKYFTMKPRSVGPPKIYLGGHMQKITLEMEPMPGVSARRSMSKLLYTTWKNTL